MNFSVLESFSREYTSICEEYRTEITSLNRQVLPNHKTWVTNSQAFQESLGVALEICVIVSWFLLEVVPDFHVRVNRDLFFP